MPFAKALAQAGDASAPAAAPKAVVLPVVDPAVELAGRPLVDALKKGGFVLYMRHAQNSGTTPPPCAQNDLTPLGEEQSRKVGAALRDLSIPVGRVMASELCRTQGTAKLVAGKDAEVTEDLNPVAPRPGFDLGAARLRRLAEMPAPGTNTLLVSHMHGGRNKAEWLHLEMAEVIVFRPGTDGAAAAVARIPLERWAELIKSIVPQ